MANSLSDHNRATGYGLRTTIMQICSVFAPTIGGIIVFYFGGISTEGIRPLYFIQLIGFTAITIYIILKLKDIKTDKTGQAKDLLKHFKEMLNAGKGLKRFAFIQATQAITVGMRTPFSFVYAVQFKGADSLIIGYMGTCVVLVSMLLAIPMGSLADRRGRKLGVFIIRPFWYGSFLLLVFAPKGATWLLLVAWCMRGVVLSSNAWETMLIEMVPEKFRGRWIGFVGLSRGFISVPAMLFGGYLYESVNPALVFLIPLAVDAFVTMPILGTIPETLKRKD